MGTLGSTFKICAKKHQTLCQKGHKCKKGHVETKRGYTIGRHFWARKKLFSAFFVDFEIVIFQSYLL